MGSNTSKPNNEAAVITAKNDLDICDNSDPRSPTPEITRTPLQSKSGSKHNITKNVDLRKTFESTNNEEKLVHNNPILSAVIKNHLQSYDPRSPTQDFERTPIVITSTTDETPNDKNVLRLRHHANNCASPILRSDLEDECDSCNEAYEKSPDLVVSRNLCEGLFNVTLDDTLKEHEPLCSSTASREAIENNISKASQDKPTEFLETNFDYIENDNDTFEDSEDNIQNLESSELNDDVNHVPVYKILGDDPRSPSIGIERTPIVVAKIEEDSNEGNVENMSDDTLIKVLQKNKTELHPIVNKLNNNGEGLLVYEDEPTDINDTPRKHKSGSLSGSRTPLSCMKNKADTGHTRSKSANTLYDPKQLALSKIPKRSHIPRLKCLTKQSKLMPAGSSVSLKNISKTSAIGGDCENTPPHSHRDRWDKDTSIVL